MSTVLPALTTCSLFLAQFVLPLELSTVSLFLFLSLALFPTQLLLVLYWFLLD